MKKLLAYDPAKKKTIKCGQYIGNILFRDVEAQHFMKVVQGYGIQEVAFQSMAEVGITKIVIKEHHTDMRWEADLQTWLKHGRVADYGHGKQRFLSMKYLRQHTLPKTDSRKEAVRG